MTSRPPTEGDGEYDEQDGDSLPTYEYLAERNPNGRFGRWREWVEKRAAERYVDIDDAERQRRRERGWGNDMFDDEHQDASSSYEQETVPIPDPSRLSTSTVPGAAPPIYTELAQLHLQPRTSSTGTAIDPANIAIYTFGSRFIPHSKSPIHAILPIMQDRFLLIGTEQGMSMIDTAPSNIDENSNLVEGLHAAIQRDLWTGESIYQLSLLECNETPGGVPRGVVMALVGCDTDEATDFCSVRMYSLSSLASLAIWAASQKTNQPVDLQPLAKCSSAQNSFKKHRARGSMTRSIRGMMAEPSSPPTSENSNPIPEPRPPRPPPKSTSVDSAQSQWDVVDDLPLRWASDYVSLASASSKLGGMSAICYEIWQAGAGGISQTKLAVATKNHIFLYATPKGERAFKFVKDYYTPLPPRQLKFVHQNPDKAGSSPTQGNGHRRGLSAPLNMEPSDQLCLFVRYDKKAGLIRLGDSAVSEVELAEDSLPTLQEPVTTSSRSGSVRKSLSMSVQESINSAREKNKWLLPSQLFVPGTNTSLYFLTKGFSTHILPNPLPNPINSKRPYKTINWKDPPSSVVPKIINTNSDLPPMLQLLALGPDGVEVQEHSFSFLTKGKGRASSDPLIKASYDSGPVGFLAFGGAWHRQSRHQQEQSEQRPDSPSSFSTSFTRQGNEIHEEGVYAWVMKGYQDYRVVWFGGDGEVA